MSNAQQQANNIRSVEIMSSKTTTGAGDWYQLPKDKTIEITGITAGTVKIQGSNSGGSNAYDLATVTADGMYETNKPYVFTRINVTVATDVDVTATAAYEQD